MVIQSKKPKLTVVLCLCLAGCGTAPVQTTSSATINLVKASEIKTIECEAAFAVGVNESDKDDDGSSWNWLKSKNGTLSHYCRQQPSGIVTAWDEVSRNQGTTHSLTYRTDASTSRFAAIES